MTRMTDVSVGVILDKHFVMGSSSGQWFIFTCVANLIKLHNAAWI
jgi:hypothetical protein